MTTMTYDPTPADHNEFSPEEMDSLRVGEELSQQEDALLAGKYENAEQLERAYLELQQKLGQPREEEEEYQEQEVQEEEYQETTDNYNQDGTINWARVDEEYGELSLIHI